MDLLLLIGALGCAVAALVHATRVERTTAQRVELLHRQIQQAQDALHRRGDLANEVAHEIKNPLTAIICSAEALDLILGAKLEPVHRETLRYIRDYGEQLLHLVGDFLDVSRAECGDITARPEVVKFGQVVKTVVGLLQSHAIRKKITISLELPDNEPLITADPRHVRQILFNLVHNALKFTPELGKVVVAVAPSSQTGFLTCSVSDNGPGVPAELRDRIFDPYARFGKEGSNSADPYTLSGTGVGLGLALSKTLIELSGGSISIGAGALGGASFRCEFRSAELPEEELRQSAAHPSSRPPLEGIRVLLVDEHADARASMARLIEAWGGVVKEVELATEALEALRTTAIDIVITDNERTPEAIESLRSGVDARGVTPRVVLTSKAKFDVQELGKMVAVPKPFSSGALYVSLRGERDSR